MNRIAYIHNHPFEFQEGENILEFVRKHKGHDAIPTLCQAQNLSAIGACRLCKVETSPSPEGKRKMVASCHTPVSEGLHIFPDSPRLDKLRKNIVELILTDHPLTCLTCEANGHCELQEVAARVGIRETRYPAGSTHMHYAKDKGHPYMTSDMAKCINCSRCIQACDEVQGEFVLSMAGRGFDSHVIKGLDSDFAHSPCVSCGACAQACPTSAISDIFQYKAMHTAEVVRTVCTYCGVGCNLDVHVHDDKVLKVTAPYDAAVNEGHLCVKGRYAFGFYKHKDRLRSPLLRKNGKLEPVSWDEAYDFITKKLTAIRQAHGPDAIAGISSSRCTNEENYLMQKFIRAVIGTNNIDGCARICHAPTAIGMQRAFGTGAATNSIIDLQHTDCMLVVGANPTDAHPVTGARIKQAAMKGKTLIVVDPRKTELARYADIHLQLRPGTNVALLNLMMYYIVTEGLVDQDFVWKRCEGFPAFKEKILQLDVDRMEAICGVPRDLIRKAAIAYAGAPNAMSFHGLGVTEHWQGTFGVMMVANLALLTGNIGRQGVGVNPLRGQNNVQGSADMGVQPNQGAGYMDITDPAIRKKYEAFYGASLSPDVGYRIPEMLDAAKEGKLKALWIMGEDVVQTEPNSAKVRKALEKLELLVVQELFLSNSAEYATVVLPGSSFLEKNGTFTNGERRIQRVNQAIDPLPGTKPDGQIIVDMMNRMGYAQADYDAATMLEEISQIVPFFAGVSWENLGINGKQWPVSPDGTGTGILHTESFTRGPGLISFVDFDETEELVKNRDEFPYILTTNRALAHYNCGTMTRRTGNRQILPEDLLWIHPADAKEKEIAEGDWVCISSPRGKADIRARLTDAVKPGILSSTFHFPDIMINNVTSDVYDSEAVCPEYKVVAVDIRKSKGKGKPVNGK